MAREHQLNLDVGRKPEAAAYASESSTPSGVLTPDLLRAAVRRLRYVGFINALIGSLFILIDIVFRRPMAAPGGLATAIVAIALGVLLSLGLTWLSTRLDPRILLDVAILYEIALGFLISVQYHAAPMPLQAGARGWPPVAVWLVVFSLLIPNTRRKVVFATLATAAMDPVGLLFQVLAGVPVPPVSELFLIFLPTVIAASASIVVSRILYDLTVAVKQARELGSYYLVSPLGRGGMGEVWRAQHGMLARPAAIKLIRPDASGGISKDLLVRFEREAQATAALRSPHTVEVYDFGMTDEGSFYYVMELLTGLDADTLVRRHGPVPPERAVYLLLQVCKSLEEAHAREFVHRDIKPANIFVCRYGLEYDFVKVLDFGLVKSIGFAENGTLTATGVVAGTPEYMAPEIARGERHFDHRADLYSRLRRVPASLRKTRFRRKESRGPLDRACGLRPFAPVGERRHLDSHGARGHRHGLPAKRSVQSAAERGRDRRPSRSSAVGSLDCRTRGEVVARRGIDSSGGSRGSDVGGWRIRGPTRGTGRLRSL